MPSHRVVRHQGYAPALDGVRAIAVVGVFLLHLARQYVPGGAFGVDVFFVLSAFLITSILLDEIDTTGHIDFSAFYWRRAFRLVPALILWIILASVTAIVAGDAAKVPWSITSTLFYCSDFFQAWTDHVAAAFDQAWSLAVEEQFYFIWPVILLLLTRLGPGPRRKCLHLLVVVAAIVACAGPNYFLPTAHLLPLAIGCWAADQLGHHTVWVDRLVNVPLIDFAALASFAVAAFIEPVGLISKFLLVLVSSATALLVLNISSMKIDIVNSILGSALLVWLGARSYGVYLYGLTLIQFVPLLTELRLTYAAPIDIIITTLAVAASYRFVELPVRSRGRRWLRDRMSEAVSEKEPGPRMTH